jgi:hypothetical protein
MRLVAVVVAMQLAGCASAPLLGPRDGGGSDAGADGGIEPGTGDAGTLPSPAAMCPVPSMVDLYSGLLPPNPYGPVPAADACIAAEHDAIVLLGCPNQADGRPAPCQVARADIAVALMRRGYGSRFIATGGAIQTPQVEAETLKALLVARGVSPDRIWTDPLAAHTDENLYYSTRIMEANGWRSALVVSDDPGHLIMTAVCDSNCCVRLGRLTVFEMATGSGTFKVGHYARYPWAATVSSGECTHLQSPLKLMCLNRDSRQACADNFRLPP